MPSIIQEILLKLAGTSLALVIVFAIGAELSTNWNRDRQLKRYAGYSGWVLLGTLIAFIWTI